MVEVPARSSMSNLLSCTGSDEVRAFNVYRLPSCISSRSYRRLPASRGPDEAVYSTSPAPLAILQIIFPINIADLSCALHSCYVPETNFSRGNLLHVRLGDTLPNHLPGRLEILPKADQGRPSRTSACFPVAILRFYYRNPCSPPRPNPRI